MDSEGYKYRWKSGNISPNFDSGFQWDSSVRPHTKPRYVHIQIETRTHIQGDEEILRRLADFGLGLKCHQKKKKKERRVTLPSFRLIVAGIKQNYEAHEASSSLADWAIHGIEQPGTVSQTHKAHEASSSSPRLGNTRDCAAVDCFRLVLDTLSGST